MVTKKIKLKTPKLAKIKKAYGKHFKECDPDENGWSKEPCGFELQLCIKDEIDYLNFDVSNTWRPLSLKGIETNNGWKTIQEHGYPKDMQKVSVITPTDIIVDTIYISNHFKCIGTSIDNVTHWRPKEIIPLPIY